VTTKEPPFPVGVATRPAGRADLEFVTELLRSAEMVDHGAPETTAEDVASGWDRPDFDITQDSVMVFDRTTLAAYAEIYGWRAEAAVHPVARSRGIGAALLAWTETAKLARGATAEEARIGQTVIDSNQDAVALFTGSDYEPRHTSWALRLPREAVIERQPLPEGYSIRPFQAETEELPAYHVIEDAFNEWPNRTPSTFQNWQAQTTGRADFDPSLLFVALHRGKVVGASLGLPYPEEGWVHQIAVQREHRRRGLATALLGAVFEEMRSLGLPEVGLSTDSRTGALDLYLDMGMIVRQTFTHYSKLLRPGVDNKATS
jgi:mycothiol synthase